jgi:hypothetical protein
VLTLIGVVVLASVGHYTLAEVWQMNASGKEYYQSLMVSSGDGVPHGHSLWGLLRLPSLLKGLDVESWRTTLYIVVAGLIFLVFSAYAVFIEKERWKRVLFAVVPAVLLPFISGDYTLIWLYFPLIFFLKSPRVSRLDAGYVALFGVLLIPLDYWYLTEGYGGVSTSVVVYPLALLALPVLAILDRHRSASSDLRGEFSSLSERNERVGP